MNLVAACAHFVCATGLKDLKKSCQSIYIRHFREGGNPGDIEQIRLLDFRLRGNDEGDHLKARKKIFFRPLRNIH